jgi:hypothetical protein
MFWPYNNTEIQVNASTTASRVWPVTRAHTYTWPIYPFTRNGSDHQRTCSSLHAWIIHDQIFPKHLLPGTLFLLFESDRMIVTELLNVYENSGHCVRQPLQNTWPTQNRNKRHKLVNRWGRSCGSLDQVGVQLMRAPVHSNHGHNMRNHMILLANKKMCTMIP